MLADVNTTFSDSPAVPHFHTQVLCALATLLTSFWVFRTRYAQALLAASKAVLQASGNLKEIERKLNLSVSMVAGCQYITVVAYYDPGRWYLTAAGTRHPLQVRIQCCIAHELETLDSADGALWRSMMWAKLASQGPKEAKR